MESDDEVIIKGLCGLSDVEVTDVEIEGGIAPVDSGDLDYVKAEIECTRIRAAVSFALENFGVGCVDSR